MPRPDPHATELGERLRLGGLAIPRGGRSGEAFGRGAGASLEFQDRRGYAPGDDVRQLDWAAYARSGELLVRMHREEVQPRLEVLLDGSRSMAVDTAKAQAAVDWAALLCAAGEATGARVRLWCFEEGWRPLELPRFREEGVEFTSGDGPTGTLAQLSMSLKPGAVRLFLSDLLFPHEPEALVRPLAATAGSLAVLQLLTPEERKPTPGTASRLVDVESGESLDLVVDEAAVAAYRARLERLTRGVDEACRRAGAGFARLPAGAELSAICREELVPRAILVAP